MPEKKLCGLLPHTPYFFSHTHIPININQSVYLINFYFGQWKLFVGGFFMKESRQWSVAKRTHLRVDGAV